jgi:hypothetical protein
MAMAHTPGPWTVATVRNKGCWVNATERRDICRILYPWHKNQEGSKVKYAEEGVGASLQGILQRNANARLIAAAPDLLAACKAALECFGDVPCRLDHHGLCQEHNLRTNEAGNPECQVSLLRAAIAKAEGASNGTND